MDGWTDGLMNVQCIRWMVQRAQQIEYRLNGWIDEWKNEWISEWMDGWSDQQINEWSVNVYIIIHIPVIQRRTMH